MIAPKPNYKKFQKIINEHAGPDRQYTESDAIEAFHNLAGFITLLIEINDRVGLVKDEPEHKITHSKQVKKMPLKTQD